MSFKISRGTLGSLAILTAIRNASSRAPGGVLHDEGFGAFFN
jgi:hypothetical protein